MKDKLYDEKGNAAHYNTERVNSIRVWEKAYGTLAVMYFCELNSKKYRDRMGKKPGQSIERELKKAEWYERAAKYYREKILAGKADIGLDGIEIKDGRLIIDIQQKKLPWLE